MTRRFFAVAALVLLLVAVPPAAAAAAEFPEMNLADFNDVASHHPAGAALKRLFPVGGPPARDVQLTGLTKQDYLKLIAGNVDYWKQHLSEAGAILDPYEKGKEGNNLEKQYSTPAFASAAALLVKEAGRDDLLEPASRAFEFALSALLNKTTANQHPDFYIPMLVHAYRILHERAPREQAARWEQMMKAIDPQEHYKDRTAGANWNVVNVAGEALRRKSGLVADEQKDAQQKYLDEMLQRQQRRFTKYGLYADPHVPLAYDAFPRMWLEEMLADDACNGPQRQQLERFLTLGGLSSLLMLSPQGEWPSGGRSAQHQWNEAQNAVICEINASKWKHAGRPDLAGSFKRAARLGLRSMFRWQRPSGEMWIVKNRAEPAERLGFEGYSFHSQYNLLPAAMLAVAYNRADDSIEEKPVPSESGWYVFELGAPFTFVIAAAGGNYVLVNTSADHHYDATGLQRIHRAGVELSPLSGSSGRASLAPGVQWKDGDKWIGLGHFHRPAPPPRARPGQPPPPPREPQRTVKQADVQVKPYRVGAEFSVTYHLDGPGARQVYETYYLPIDGDRVDFTQRIPGGGGPAGSLRCVFPVLVSDGLKDLDVNVESATITISSPGGALAARVRSPNDIKFQLTGSRIRAQNGYLQAAVAEFPPGPNEATWDLRLTPAATGP